MNLASQAVRFVLVGAGALATNLAITYALTEWILLWYFYSFLLGTLIAWTLTFFLNGLFTFNRAEAIRPGNYLLFLALYCSSFMLNAGLVYSLTEWWGVYYLFSVMGASLVSAFGTFFLSKKFIYGSGPYELGRVLRFVRSHGAALVLAVAVGVVAVAPYVTFQFDPAYLGLEMMASDAEEHYVARIQEVYDGYPTAGNVFRDEKNVPFASGNLGEAIVATLGKTLGLNAAEINVWGRLLFIPLIVLLIYALVYSLVGLKTAALISSVAPVLGYNVLSKPSLLFELLRGEFIGGNFLVFARPINPEVSSVCLFGALLLLYRGFYMRSPSWWEVAGVGLLTGASLYISPFVFSFLGFLIICVFLWHLFARDLARAGSAFVAGLIGIISALPFLVNYLALQSVEGYAELSMRAGVVLKHEFLIGFWIPIMVLAVMFLWPHHHAKARTFLLTVFAALFLVINQQVITGFHLQLGHYHWYITKPMVAIMAGIYAGLIFSYLKNIRWQWLLTAGVLAVLFYNGIVWQVHSYRDAYARAVNAQAYAPAMEYLNTLSEVQNVWGDMWESFYVPIYTHHNAPNNPFVIYYLNPQEFYEARQFLKYRLEDVRPTQVLEAMKKDSNDLSMGLFGMFLRENTGDHNAIREEEYRALAEKYRAFYARPYAEVFKNLGITMVLVPLSERKKYDAITALRQVADLGSLTIYELKD